MAKFYYKEAHENDDDPEIVYVVESGDPGDFFAAKRTGGVWKEFGIMSGWTLQNDYSMITDPARIDHLFTEAKRSLSVSPVRAK